MKDRQKGGREPSFSYSVDRTPSLHVLGDLNAGSSAGEEVPLACNRGECPCNCSIVLEQRQTTEDCTDWVLVCVGPRRIS